MARKNSFKQQMDAAKRRVRRAAGEAGVRMWAIRPGDGHTINVARRTNIIVATNVGEENATRAVSSRQSTHTVQDGRERPGNAETSTATS